jgi:hypothetical protein
LNSSWLQDKALKNSNAFVSQLRVFRAVNPNCSLPPTLSFFKASFTVLIDIQGKNFVSPKLDVIYQCTSNIIILIICNYFSWSTWGLSVPSVNRLFMLSVLKQRHQEERKINYFGYFSEMCVWVPWQNRGENCALLENL